MFNVIIFLVIITLLFGAVANSITQFFVNVNGFAEIYEVNDYGK